jgi:hypothetical protein
MSSALDEDLVQRQQVVQLLHARRKIFDKLANLVKIPGRQVMRYTADPQIVVQQPGTADPLKQVENFLAIAETP